MIQGLGGLHLSAGKIGPCYEACILTPGCRIWAAWKAALRQGQGAAHTGFSNVEFALGVGALQSSLSAEVEERFFGKQIPHPRPDRKSEGTISGRNVGTLHHPNVRKTGARWGPRFRSE
jgi:hypothetical protein